jgi:hypothetical protein
MARTAKDLPDYLSHSSTLLPEQLALDQFAETILRQHKQGGSTVSRYFGDAAGQKLYAVSVYPDCTALVPGQ